MRFETRTMEVPTSAGTGAAVTADRFTEKSVLVAGTFTATIRIQASLDGSNWSDITGDLTTGQIVEVPHTVRYLRVRTVAWTSSPAVSFSGLDARAV